MNIYADKIRIILLVFLVSCCFYSLQAQSSNHSGKVAQKKGSSTLAAKKAALKKASLLQQRYGHIDSYALAAPAEVCINIKLLTSYLSLAPPCITREEKLRSIYTWLTHNIKFDWYMWAYENKLGYGAVPDSARNFVQWNLFKIRMNDKKYKNSSTINSILDSRKATDKGISKLFIAMCYEAGLKGLEITGYKKDNLWQKGDMIYRTNHKWNAVYLGKRWNFIDIVNRYWILDQKEMKKNMIPSEPMWQMTKKPISMNGFINNREEYFSENYSYIDTIKSIQKMNPQKKKIARAKMINRFNPDNYSEIAYAYLEVSKEMFFLCKSPTMGMKKAQSGFDLAAKNFKIAATYLKGIKSSELKPVAKNTMNRNKAFNKDKAGEFKVKLKELDALKKEGPPESTLEDDLAMVNEEYSEKLSILETELAEKKQEAGDLKAMQKLVEISYTRRIDSVKKAQKEAIKAAQEKDKMRGSSFNDILKAKKDSISKAGDDEDDRFNRVKKITKKKLKNDLKVNTKDTFYAKNMAKKAKKEAKKMKGSIKKREKEIKENQKKQAAKDKEAAKKAAADQKALDAKIKAKQKEEGK